jgi:phosphoribosylformylglycinamidine synthase
MGLSDEEYAAIIEIMGREPNLLETGIWSVMWSEHCGYKNSRPLLKQFPTQGPQVIQGPGENAGVVDIGNGQALVFKVESHNHPSAIEPYQGAATGVGGIVRDIFTMGARPIALLDSLRFGPLEEPRVRELFSGVVAGIAGYGNCLGIPTVGGEVYFDPAYQDNLLVNAMCVGLVNTDEIAYAVANDVGAPIMIVGARTGRDGIHGATFASEELSEASSAKRSSVQVGDPFMEKLLIEACLELVREKLISGMQDLGAAGLTSSIVETAGKKDRGVEVDVQLVPRREKDMTPYEVMLSESQERMLIIPKAGCEAKIETIFSKWGLQADVIGRVTNDGVFRVLEAGRVVGEVPVKALTEGCPTYVREGVEPDYYASARAFDPLSLAPPDLIAAARQLLASPSLASKAWVYEQYDYQVMTNTVVLPGDGDAAVLRIRHTDRGVAFTIDCNARMVYLDPYRGGMMAVAEAARNLACTGAKPLALTNCLNFCNPEKPHVYWQMQRAVAGMSEAARALSTPVVSGNVSLYNETEARAIYPTPVVGMVGVLERVEQRVTMDFKRAGDQIVLLGAWSEELGGSEYLAVVQGITAGAVPRIDLAGEKNLQALLLAAAARKLLRSCHDVSDGGIWLTLAESGLKGGLGWTVTVPPGRPEALLFSEAPTRAVVSIGLEDVSALADLAADFGVPCAVLGEVTSGGFVVRQEQDILCLPREEALDLWGGSIRCVMQ